MRPQHPALGCGLHLTLRSGLGPRIGPAACPACSVATTRCTADGDEQKRHADVERNRRLIVRRQERQQIQYAAGFFHGPVSRHPCQSFAHSKAPLPPDRGSQTKDCGEIADVCRERGNRLGNCTGLLPRRKASTPLTRHACHPFSPIGSNIGDLRRLGLSDRRRPRLAFWCPLIRTLWITLCAESAPCPHRFPLRRSVTLMSAEAALRSRHASVTLGLAPPCAACMNTRRRPAKSGNNRGLEAMIVG